MAKLEKDDLSVTTSLPSEIVSLKAQGFRVVEEDKAEKVADVPAAPVTETPRAEVAKPAAKSSK